MDGASTTTLVAALTVTVPASTSIFTMLEPLSSETAIVLLSSCSAMMRPSSLRKTLTSGVAFVPPSSVGTLSLAPQPPVQIGRETSPASNSTHTPAPTGGTAYAPVLSPAYGAHGSAQPLS